MSDHYCCKRCGQQYDKCECCLEDQTPKQAKKTRRKADKEKPVLGLIKTRVDELDDFSGALYALKNHVERLIHKYGPEARIYFDAGHNNVEVLVEHRPVRYGTLTSLPDAAVCGQVALTVGMRYAIREENGSGELLIDTDHPNMPLWVHRSRLEHISQSEET